MPIIDLSSDREVTDAQQGKIEIEGVKFVCPDCGTVIIADNVVDGCKGHKCPSSSKIS